MGSRPIPQLPLVHTHLPGHTWSRAAGSRPRETRRPGLLADAAGAHPCEHVGGQASCAGGPRTFERSQRALELQNPHLDQCVLLGAHALARGAVVVGARLRAKREGEVAQSGRELLLQ